MTRPLLVLLALSAAALAWRRPAWRPVAWVLCGWAVVDVARLWTAPRAPAWPWGRVDDWLVAMWPGVLAAGAVRGMEDEGPGGHPSSPREVVASSASSATDSPAQRRGPVALPVGTLGGLLDVSNRLGADALEGSAARATPPTPATTRLPLQVLSLAALYSTALAALGPRVAAWHDETLRAPRIAAAVVVAVAWLASAPSTPATRAPRVALLLLAAVDAVSAAVVWGMPRERWWLAGWLTMAGYVAVGGVMGWAVRGGQGR